MAAAALLLRPVARAVERIQHFRKAPETLKLRLRAILRYCHEAEVARLTVHTYHIRLQLTGKHALGKGIRRVRQICIISAASVRKLTRDERREP